MKPRRVIESRVVQLKSRSSVDVVLRKTMKVVEIGVGLAAEAEAIVRTIA